MTGKKTRRYCEDGGSTSVTDSMEESDPLETSRRAQKSSVAFYRDSADEVRGRLNPGEEP